MLSTNKTGAFYCFFIILTADWSTNKTGDLYSLTAFLLAKLLIGWPRCYVVALF